MYKYCAVNLICVYSVGHFFSNFLFPKILLPISCAMNASASIILLSCTWNTTIGEDM